MPKKVQIIVDVDVPEGGHVNKEQLADLVEEFVCDALGSADMPMPARAVKVWWKPTPVE
jgi:hypothetical protein